MLTRRKRQHGGNNLLLWAYRSGHGGIISNERNGTRGVIP